MGLDNQQRWELICKLSEMGRVSAAYDGQLYDSLKPLLDFYAEDIKSASYVEGKTLGLTLRAIATAVDIALGRFSPEGKK